MITGSMTGRELFEIFKKISRNLKSSRPTRQENFCVSFEKV